GITVVEAAGNGSVDLDSFQTIDGKYIFNPNSADFKDSGAIIVGAANGSLPHYRLGFSTFGNRIDAFGWGGWDVSTLDAVDENSTTGYQTWFSGTSSASPIVTSAAISIQGIAKSLFGTPYTPAELRRLLKSAAYNTPTFDPASDKIGYMPNLKEIIDNHLVTPGTVPVDTNAPSAPLNLSVTNINENYATISWNPSIDNFSLIGYDVFINGNALPDAATSQTSITLYTFNPGTTYTVTVKARDGAHNLSAASSLVTFTTASPPGCGNAPAGFNILKEAESYSNMNGVQTEGTADQGGGQNVGWIDTNDWMAYNSITIPTSGNYNISYRVASPYNGGKLAADLNANAIALGSVDIPNTGGWQNWTTVTHTLCLTAGTYNFGIFAQTGGWNINWFQITAP
ncbi:MAG: carbohydrate-binding protein, partial [Moraxellaceae bacterium]